MLDPLFTEAFNIFGYTPRANGLAIQGYYMNVDTGRYIEGGYRKLSAYCVETGETMSSAYIQD